MLCVHSSFRERSLPAILTENDALSFSFYVFPLLSVHVHIT